METALNEITLVLFTTIAPAGVIGYLVMALAVVSARDERRACALSRHLVVPLVLAISGLIASATHLGTPANALYVLTGVGRSPLSNEVVAAVAFLALGGVYWILSFRDDLRRGFRIVWLAATAIAGFAFVGFIAVAYSVPSVPTWNLPTTPLALWLNALSSGPLVGLFGMLLARQEPGRRMATALLALAACAVAANAAVLAAQWRDLAGIATTVARAVDLAPAMPLAICAYVACGAAGIALAGAGTRFRRAGAQAGERGDGASEADGECGMRAGRLQDGKASESSDPFAAVQRARITRLAFAATGAAAALAGCFAVRFAFYALHMTLGV